MSDVPRSSPWIPVNGSAPVSGNAAANTEASLPVRAPVLPQTETDIVLDTQAPAPIVPAEGVNPVRRAPALSPYFAARDADESTRAAGTTVPQLTPDDAPTAYVAPGATANPAESWAPMRPTGIDPTYAAAASASPVALTKPAQPVVAGPTRVPQPIDIDEPEVIRPVAAPPVSEILPTTGSNPLVTGAPAFDPSQASTFEPSPVEQDPFRLLGESAVAAASLDAAGARTPAAGIVLPAARDVVPSLGDDQEFVPRFEPETQAPPPRAPERLPLTGEQPRVSFTEATGLASATTAGVAALAPLPQAPVQPATSASWADVAGQLPSNTPSSGDVPTVDASGYAPVTAGALTVTAPPMPPESPETADDKPRRGRKWLWIALAIVAGAALGVVVYRLFLLPEPIILPAPVVTEAAPTPTIEPVSVTDPSEFLAGMPTEVGTFVLTTYEVVEVIGDESLPARTAEHLILTYGQATGEAHFTVNAYQFYNPDDAQTAFTAWSEGAAATSDVVVDGETVGERALVTSGSETSVVWRNGSSVFVLDGPANEVEQFYAYFGI